MVLGSGKTFNRPCPFRSIRSIGTMLRGKTAFVRGSLTGISFPLSPALVGGAEKIVAEEASRGNQTRQPQDGHGASPGGHEGSRRRSWPHTGQRRMKTMLGEGRWCRGNARKHVAATPRSRCVGRRRARAIRSWLNMAR